MKRIIVNINSNSRVIKYKKTKLIRFSSIEIIEILKKFKKSTQIMKKQFDSIESIKQILNTFIKIVFANCLIFLSNCSNKCFAASLTKK